jgi:hypothetical protein
MTAKQDMAKTEFNRRDLLKVVGFAVTTDLLNAQSHHSADHAFSVPRDYRPRLLSPPEYELTAELCEIIIPSDSDSPGAKEAGVPWFIDTVLLYATAERQDAWRSGLKEVDALAARLRGATFLRCSAPDRLEIVKHLARNEDLPESPEEKFFGEIKALSVQAFCLSDIGMKEYLHYRGNTSIPDFPGCPTETSS